MKKIPDNDFSQQRRKEKLLSLLPLYHASLLLNESCLGRLFFRVSIFGKYSFLGLLLVAKYFLGGSEIPNSADSCLYVCQVHPMGPVLKWDYLKYKSDTVAKKYSVDRAKEHRDERNELKLRVKELEVLPSTDSQEIAKEYYDCKQELA